MPKDLLEIALRNEKLAELAMRNPGVSNSFIAIIDRMMLFFGDKIDKLDVKIAGPSEGYDMRFILGGK